jgi:hypothetical protein
MDLPNAHITVVYMQLCVLDTIYHAAFNKLETSQPNALCCSLSRIPPSMFSSTLPGMLPRMLPTVLDVTLLACLTYSLKKALKDARNCT